MRASGAPRQKCTPAPNARCGLGSRSGRKVSGVVEDGRVAVGGAEQRRDLLAGLDGDVADPRPARSRCARTAGARSRSGASPPRSVGTWLRRRPGAGPQHRDQAVAEHVDRRLVAGVEQQHGGGDDLVLAEPPSPSWPRPGRRPGRRAGSAARGAGELADRVGELARGGARPRRRPRRGGRPRTSARSPATTPAAAAPARWARRAARRSPGRAAARRTPRPRRSRTGSTSASSCAASSRTRGRSRSTWPRLNAADDRAAAAACAPAARSPSSGCGAAG